MRQIIKLVLDFDITIFKKWKLSKVLLISGIVLSLLWSGYFMYRVLKIPHQITYLEGTASVHTWFYLRGMNPFSLENQPLGITLYGFMYNLMVFPFAVWFGNTLMVHRAVNLVFIVLASVIYYFVAFKERKNHLIALACSAFVMTSLAGVQGLGGISAYPAPTGTFFFVAAIFIPFLFSFDTKSLILSIFLALAGFYTKPYFILSFGIVASYVFLFVSPKKGLIYGISFIITLLISILVVKNIFPLYFVGTIWANVSQTTRSLEHLLFQLNSLLNTFSFLIIIIIMTFIADGIKGNSIKKSYKINISKWNAPLLGYSLNYIVFAFGITLLAFVTILGWHAPNPLGYAYQLVAPLFICLAFSELIQENKTNLVTALLVIINLFTWQSSIMSPRYLQERSTKEWNKLLGYLNGVDSFVHPPIMVTDIMSLGYAPMDSGQTIIFYTIFPYPDTILTDIPYETIRRDGYGYNTGINRRIEKRQYDVIIIQKDKAQFFDAWALEQNYNIVDEINIELNMGGVQTFQVWKPKP
ncbi:MAG: hypothetical protein U0X74_14050 [Anaerolineales bacterium]